MEFTMGKKRKVVPTLDLIWVLLFAFLVPLILGFSRAALRLDGEFYSLEALINNLNFILLPLVALYIRGTLEVNIFFISYKYLLIVFIAILFGIVVQYFDWSISYKKGLLDFYNSLIEKKQLSVSGAPLNAG